MLRMSYSDHFLSVVHPAVRALVHPLTLSNNSSKAIDAICPLFGKNVALLKI